MAARQGASDAPMANAAETPLAINVRVAPAPRRNAWQAAANPMALLDTAARPSLGLRRIGLRPAADSASAAGMRRLSKNASPTPVRTDPI